MISSQINKWYRIGKIRLTSTCKDTRAHFDMMATVILPRKNKIKYQLNKMLMQSPYLSLPE